MNLGKEEIYLSVKAHVSDNIMDYIAHSQIILNMFLMRVTLSTWLQKILTFVLAYFFSVVLSGNVNMKYKFVLDMDVLW